MAQKNNVKKLEGALLRLTRADFSSEIEHFVSAAILFHAVPIDGIVRLEEIDKLQRILVEDFDLSSEQADTLMAIARDNDESKGFFSDTVEMARSSLNESQKKNLISQLWEVVFSDGHLHEMESNLVLQVGVDIGLDVEEACSLMTSNE